MSKHNFWLCRDDSTRLLLLDDWAIEFEYAKVFHQIGALSLKLQDGFDETLLNPDARIEVWREPEGGHRRLERVYMLRRVVDETDENGLRTLELTALDANYLLAGRVVAYASGEGSPQAAKTDYTDDMMKEIVAENGGLSGTSARRFPTDYFSIQADASLGPEITATFPNANVLETLQNLVAASRAKGTPVYFDMVPVTPSTWQFQTWVHQPGIDHTYPSGTSIMMFGLEQFNLQKPRLERDWTNEATVVRAGGQGTGLDREYVTREDTTRSGRSLFGRREVFIEASDEDTTGLIDVADRRLDEGRPRLSFSAELEDFAGYGLIWDWGDKLPAIYRGQQYNAIVKSIHVRVDPEGKETVRAGLEWFDAGTAS